MGTQNTDSSSPAEPRWDHRLDSHKQEQHRPWIASGATRKQRGLSLSVRTGLGKEEQQRLGCEGMAGYSKTLKAASMSYGNILKRRETLK